MRPSQLTRVDRIWKTVTKSIVDPEFRRWDATTSFHNRTHQYQEETVAVPQKNNSARHFLLVHTIGRRRCVHGQIHPLHFHEWGKTFPRTLVTSIHGTIANDLSHVDDMELGPVRWLTCTSLSLGLITPATFGFSLSQILLPKMGPQLWSTSERRLVYRSNTCQVDPPILATKQYAS